MSHFQVFAFKILNNTDRSIPSEVDALQKITMSNPSNEHIVDALDYWFNMDDELVIFRTIIKLQRCDGTLREYLDDLKARGLSMDPLNLTEIMIHILSGLCHCHKRQVCHRDVKESNSFPFIQLH